MSYNIVQPSFSLEFREMSDVALQAYFEWFLEQIPLRLRIVEASVKESPGFECWTANFSPGSLKPLGEWYAAQLQFWPRTRREVYEIRRRLSFPVPLSNREPANKTFSVAVDIAVYFSEVLRRNFPTVRWAQCLKSRTNADYGQPVLTGFGRASLNPVSAMVVLANQLAKKSEHGAKLFELYNYWSSQVR